MKRLTAKDLIIGGKYVPHSKSWYEDETLEDSVAWRKAQAKGQPYLYYVGVDEDWGHSPTPMFWHEYIEDDKDSGDYFLPSDVTPYIEPNTEAKQYEAPATLFESNERLINKDGTCPVTGEHCDDECCLIGAECNASSDDVQDCSPTQPIDPKDFLPFNLEEALKAPERVVHRNGERPLEWFYFKNCITRWPVGVVLPSGGLSAYDVEGNYQISKTTNSLDLMLLPLPKTTYWINAMEEEFSGVIYITGPWRSELEAFQQMAVPDKFVKLITFEI